MAYATLSEVMAEAPQLRLSATSKPTVDEAKKLIEQVSAQTEAVVKGLGFALPIVGPQSLIVLRDIVVQGAIAKILKAMYWGIKNPDDVGANAAWNEFTRKLRQLADPDDPFDLPDAEMTLNLEKVTPEFGYDVASSLDAVESDIQLYRPSRNQVF